MKVKILFSILLVALILVSMSQIFSIPPYAGDIFPVYKSGYFKELDRGFSIITDSFIGIKVNGEAGIRVDISLRTPG